ncbi:MAG: threonine/serine dehydratase [Caldilineaceae bacterium]|nr:threonine/serine dehydratase [Caldilineaceae bacterium]
MLAGTLSILILGLERVWLAVLMSGLAIALIVLLHFVTPANTGVMSAQALRLNFAINAARALSVMLNTPSDELANGVTAVSAGNHAIAVAFAAQLLGVTAKVVMPKSANPLRVARCQGYGAEVVLVDNVADAFDRVHQIQEEENRVFVHPFEGLYTVLGTATVGLEFGQQTPDLDAVIVPIGGGGLCAGVAAAIKQMQPNCKIFGVEPVGADSMYRSLRSGKPEAIDAVRTIADSLGAPYATPETFALCQRFVDEVILLDDDAMRRAMGLLFLSMKLAVEPAGAAATAALCGPLAERLRGKRVGVVVCGTNIDLETFAKQALFNR